jgi:peptide/nickel transport system substrate-binding protein
VRHSRIRGAGLALITAALLASACSSDSKKDVTAGATTSAPSTTEAAKQGGDLVFGAEQEPDCMDWIGSCAGSSWGVYTTQALTMPRSFDFEDGKYSITPLLADTPKLESTPKQKVTYHINPKAVWSDGEKITSADFAYTWDQVANGKDIYDKTGYEKIESVDSTDPTTAVVTYKDPYPGWRDLFGGYYGIFPKHLLDGKDRDATMKDGYTFSGGPWILDHWTKGTEIKLVPNPKYWDKVPNLASITFKLIEDTAAAQQALKSGQVSMLYPQAQPGQEQLKTIPGIKFDSITGLSYEAVWMNTSKEPFTSLAVRQALAYAVDRDAIVKQLFAPIQADIKPINSFATPAFGDLYSEPFNIYKPDTAKVDELMKGDGWAKGADGIWAKGGKKASFEAKTTQNNKRRLQTLEIMQSQVKASGFDMTVNPIKSSVLFGQDGPQGNFQAALFAQVPASNDPGQCSLWCSKNIPSAANANSGTNWYRITDAKLDDIFTKVDVELDDAARGKLSKDGQARLAEVVPAIPVDPFPDIIAYSGDVVGGKVIHNPSFGPWVHANTWFKK